MGKKVGRIGLGVATMGGSEVARAVGGKLGLGLKDEQGAYMTPEQKAAQDARDYYSNYDANMGAATKGVQEGALTKDLFGEGGLQSQLANEQQNLSSRGFQLQQPDHEAYGQASGDISRLFGQQEQDATQNLARRGLASAGSGSAGAAFSGLAGNKNEMLARAQTDIAQKRMDSTRQRLADTRNMMSSLATQGTNMANSAFAQKGASLDQAAGKENMMNMQNKQALEDKEAAVRPGLFSTIGQGLQRGVGQMAQQAPGMLLGGMGGAAASGGNPLAKMNPSTGMDGAGGKTLFSSAYLNQK